MSSWDSVDLLAQFNRLAARPTVDAVTDAQKYDRLAKAQDMVIGDLSAVAPYALYPKASYANYPTLTTSDNQLFTFGSDADGNPIAPMNTEIFPSLSAIPDDPWREGWDYLNEGTQIRIPGNRTWSGTLYWRGITATPPISAKQAPVLFPVPARELIPIKAVLSFAMEGGRDVTLAELMQAAWDRAWPRWCLVWKTQFRKGGALGMSYTGRQLSELGAY